jgi:hypothetical protein
MPQIIDIPNIGQVEFPDSMSEADVSAAAKKLYDESAPVKLPPSVALPEAEQMVPAQPTFEMPTTLTQQAISPERAATAVTAGALALPRLALSAYEFAKPPQPLREEFARLGIEEPTFAQALEKVSPDVKAVVAFEPETPIEYAAEALGGIALEAPKILTATGKTVQAAKKLQESVSAYDDAAGALFKRGKLGEAQARYELPPVKAITFDAKEAQSAKKLEKTLTRQENKIANLRLQLENPDLLPEQRTILQNQLLKSSKRNEQTIREGQLIIESDPFKALQKSKQELNAKTTFINGREVPAYQQAVSARGVYVPKEEINTIANPTQALSRPGLTGVINRVSAGPVSTVDHLRLIQEADGNRLQGPLFKLLFEPAEIAKRNRQTMVFDDINKFRAQVQELGLSDISKQRKEFLFDVADGKIAREAANLSDSENKLLNYLAKNYSDYLDQANAIRAKLDIPLIPKRQNYISHISDMSLFDELGFGLEAATADTQLSKMARPLKAKFGFEKQRQGGLYRKDPFEAFERYVNSVSKQIHYTEPAAVLNARTDFITDPVLKNAQKRFINEAFLDNLDFKDDVLIQLGARGPLNLAAKLSNNFSVAAILGNITVTTSQFSQIPATVKDAGAWPALVGLYRAFKPIPKEIADASSFLKLRQISDEVIPLNSKLLNKPQEFILKALEFTDKYVARASWEAGFVNAKRRGFSTEAAIKHADDIARMLHANYGSIYKPALLRGQTGKAALPLQSFFFNFWNYLSRDQKAIAELKNTTRLRETMKAIGAMAAANQVYRAVGFPDVFEVDAPQSMDKEELLRVAKSTAVGNIPLAKILIEGIQPPASRIVTSEAGLKKDSLMRNAYTLAFSDDPEQKEEALKSLRKGGFKFVPGGIQINKTLDGLEAAKDGYVNIGREFIPLTEEDKRLAPIVGKYRVPSVIKAREAIERRRLKKVLEGK